MKKVKKESDECKDMVSCGHITFYSVVRTIPHKEMESIVDSGQVLSLRECPDLKMVRALCKL